MIQGIKVFLTIICMGVCITKAQTEKYVICENKQLWFISNAKVIKVGKYNENTWVGLIKFTDVESASIKNLSKKELELNLVLQRFSNKNIEELDLSKTNFSKVLRETTKLEKLTLLSSSLPSYLQTFLEQTYIEFIITSGTRFIGIHNRYEEFMRFKISVKGDNSTIKTILEEVKKEERKLLTGTKDEWILDYQPYYYLEIFETQEKLDPTKTIADYNIKNGTILRPVTTKR